MTATLMQRYGLLCTMLGLTRHRGAGGLMRKVAIPAALGLVWLLHALAAHYLGADGLVAQLLAILVCVMAGIWLVVFGMFALQHNTPAYAWLVPQLRRRLLISGAVVVMLCTLVATAAISIGFGARDVGTTLVLAGLGYTAVLAAHRYYLLLIFPPIVMLGYFVVSARWGDQTDLLQAIAVSPAGITFGLLIDLLLLAWTLQRVLPGAGDAHFAMQRKLGKQMKAPSRIVPVPLNRLDVMAGWFGMGYAMALRRATQVGGSPVQAQMLAHLLGPQARPGWLLLSMSPMLLSFAAMVCMRVLNSTAMADAVGTPVWDICIFIMAPLYVYMLLAALARSTQEQCLYRLSAGAPVTTRLNGMLATVLLGRFVLVWLVALALLLVNAAVSASHWPDLDLRLAFAVCALPCGALLLRDYAAMAAAPAAIGRLISGMITIMLGQAALYLGMVWLNKELSGMNWWPVTAFMLLFSIALLRRRWLRMTTCVPAFPAGYLQR